MRVYTGIVSATMFYIIGSAQVDNNGQKINMFKFCFHYKVEVDKLQSPTYTGVACLYLQSMHKEFVMQYSLLDSNLQKMIKNFT